MIASERSVGFCANTKIACVTVLNKRMMRMLTKTEKIAIFRRLSKERHEEKSWVISHYLKNESQC